MSKQNMLPAAVQQLLEDIEDPKTPSHVRFNKMLVVEAIKECCERTLKKWENKRGK